MTDKNIIALRMERLHLTRKASESEYVELYRDCQPGRNVYWQGFGDPPGLTYRADFDDIEFNRERQFERKLIKGRFSGGNIGWIVPEDLELFTALYRKPLDKPTPAQLYLLDLIEREGPLTIQQIKEETGMRVKDITPKLHRLQEAFLIYEDQNEGQDDRGWYRFGEMFPNLDFDRCFRPDAIKEVLRRFAYRMVYIDAEMAKSYYKLAAKDIRTALADLLEENVLAEYENGYTLKSDFDALGEIGAFGAFGAFGAESPPNVFAMQKNDILVKSYSHILAGKYPHEYSETLYYLLIDGEWRGAAAGKFHFTPPDVEDVIVDLPPDEAAARKDEILAAVHALCGEENPIRRYQGKPL